MDGGLGEDPPMARVQFVDQPMAMSSQGPPPASFFAPCCINTKAFRSTVESGMAGCFSENQT